jgi:hypothetical protein
MFKNRRERSMAKKKLKFVVSRPADQSLEAYKEWIKASCVGRNFGVRALNSIDKTLMIFDLLNTF